jgi:hypothetical protein
MSWKITPADIQKIKRKKNAPYFNSVEQMISKSTAYKIDKNGYFIVAPESSLMPKYIIELHLPVRGVEEEYKTLLGELTKKSCGMMWFDTSDIDAYDFVWKLRLMLRVGSPLFMWNRLENFTPRKGYIIRDASKSDSDRIVSLMSSIPDHHGAQSKDSVKEALKKNYYKALVKDNTVVGAALLRPQPDNYVGMTMVLDSKYRNQALGLYYGALIGEDLAESGKTMVAGMLNDNPPSFKAFQNIMSIQKYGFVANLGSI